MPGNIFRTLLQQTLRRLMSMRYFRLQQKLAQSKVYQEKFLLDIVHHARQTTYGRQYDFAHVDSIRAYQTRVPLCDYTTLFPWIERCMRGERDILTAHPIKRFAQTAGTTGASSKYIPVTQAALRQNHFACSKDFLSVYLHHNPTSRLLLGRFIMLAGGFTHNPYTHETNVGYVSGILNQEKPWLGKLMSALDKNLLNETDRHKKLLAIATNAQHKNITSVGGVGPWIVMFGEYVKQLTGKEIKDVRPDFELVLSGGVNIHLYVEQYKQVFGNDCMIYNMYNSTEGFYGFQSTNEDYDILLATHHGIFYEFIPMEHFAGTDSPTITLAEVELGVEYALVITNNAGLWRYILGDTIRFTSLAPHQLQVSGRTTYYIDSFSEHVILQNAVEALKVACDKTCSIIKEFTVGPEFLPETRQGRHERIIEFVQAPTQREEFCSILDSELQQRNSYYASKRENDTLLLPPHVHIAPAGLFSKWMEQRGKLGGQNKVPNLRNERTYLEQLLALLEK